MLKIEKTNSSNYTKESGCIVSKATITAVKNISGQPLGRTGKWTPDCAIELTLDIGQSFEPTMIIAGDFKRQDDQIIDWGGAFKVKELFLACGLTGDLNEDFTIPDTLLNALVGKTISRLVFAHKRNARGNVTYREFDLVWPATADPHEYIQFFLEQVQKVTSLAKQYNPSIADDSTSTAKIQQAPLANRNMSDPNPTDEDFPF